MLPMAREERNPDEMIDRLADRAERLVHHASLRVEKRRPRAPLRFSYDVIDYLSQRLAAAEYCLQESLGIAEYRRLLRWLDLR